MVLALPRGGVPVAAEVARRLDAPLDILVVRKIGLPDNPEVAVGAIGPDGAIVLDQRFMDRLGLTGRELAPVIERERAELVRREGAYRSGRPPLNLTGRTVIIVDDGLATGSTMSVAVTAVRRKQPAAIVVAVPVASPDAVQRLARQADSVVCALTPYYFRAVGEWYDDFAQTTDAQVRACLRDFAAAPPPAPAAGDDGNAPEGPG